MEIELEYLQTVEAMGQLSHATTSLIDENLTDTSDDEKPHLVETQSYLDKKKILDAANDYAWRRIDRLRELFETTEIINKDQANKVTKRLNLYTENILQIKDFLNDNLGKNLFHKYERMIVLEGAEEYRLKLNLIYNLLFYYNSNPKDRPVEQKVELPNRIS